MNMKKALSIHYQDGKKYTRYYIRRDMLNLDQETYVSVLKHCMEIRDVLESEELNINLGNFLKGCTDNLTDKHINQLIKDNQQLLKEEHGKNQESTG